MKNLFFAVAFFSCISCMKKNNTQPNPVPTTKVTQVMVNVKDASGANVPGASVRLYICGFGQGTPLVTDNNGNVLFNNIPSTGLCDIFWIAEKGCKNNKNHLAHVPIIRDTINQHSFIIYETGIFKLTINGCNDWLLQSSVYTGQITGCSFYRFYPDAGPFNFRSGLFATPSVYKDTTLQIICNDTTYLTLPY
jgi:hypothetical protein